MLLSQCNPWWTAAPINLRLLQKLLQPMHSEFSPIHFWFFFIFLFDDSRLQFCLSEPRSSLAASVKLAKNESRTAVVKTNQPKQAASENQFRALVCLKTSHVSCQNLSDCISRPATSASSSQHHREHSWIYLMWDLCCSHWRYPKLLEDTIFF